ncbi:MAG: metallophosphoesterase [Nitrospirota bacterium]
MADVKRVFVSDVHMSPGWSFDISGKCNEGCYDWFNRDLATEFEEFLTTLIKDENLQEVILLGDIMDGWVYPIDIPPPNNYNAIVNAQHVSGIVENLRKMVKAGKKVTYVVGNHDMTLREEQYKNFRENIFAGITFQKTYDTDDGIYAEHGHSFTMYNAIDSEDDPIHWLPIGHYISRLAATLAVRNNKSYINANIEDMFHTLNAIKETVGNILNPSGDPLVNAPIDFLSKELGDVDDNTPIMTIDGGTITIGGVRKLYYRAAKEWINTHGLLGGLSSIWREALGLDLVATKKIRQDGKKIVIFGHTHKEDNGYIYKSDDYIVTGENPEPIGIYANCGAWCSGGKKASKTYVVTEYDSDTGKHSVTLRYWDKDKNDTTNQIDI